MNKFPLNRKKFLMLIAISLLCFVLIVAGVFYFRNSRHIPEWEDLNIERIRLNGVEGEFSVKNGEIYKNGKEINSWFDRGEFNRAQRVALFYQWNKEDPLLFDPNLEIESFDRALLKMKEQNEILASVSTFGYVNPVEFLESFSLGSAAYRNFLQDVSEENAQKVLLAMEESQKKYLSDAERLGGILKEGIAEGLNKNNLLFLGGETTSTVDVISEDFEKIKRNGDFLAQEIAKRQNCLKKTRCERPVDSFDKPSPIQEDFMPEITILPEDEMRTDAVDIESGPFLIHSQCWKKREVNLMYAAKFCNLSASESCVDWPLLTDGEYWAKIGPNRERKAYNEQGVLRDTQSASAPYGCLDLTYKPKIRAIKYALKEYKEGRVFNKKVPKSEDENLQKELDSIWIKGQQVESAFFDAKYPSDTSLETLGSYYAYAYKMLIEKKVSEDVLKEQLLKRANVLKGEMQNFDLILDRSTYHLKKYLPRNLDKMATSENPKYYYIYSTLATRSNYSISFLNFSPFVWRTQEKPQYFLPIEEKINDLSILPDEELRIIGYEKAVTLYGKENLKNWAKVSAEMHEEF